MQDSIARHEFVKARFYSDEERKARAQLQLLHRKYRIVD
jgi:ATP-dependent Clp protease ATP-binding subunit ClpC